MVDIHCHLIPMVDDGASSMTEALSIIEREAEGGTGTFIATPHINSVQDLDRSYELIEKLDNVRMKVEARGIDVKLFPGCELYASQAVVKALQRGLPITLAGSGKYVLLDVPRYALPLDFGAVVGEICAFGVTPILAHPERSSEFQAEPDRVLGFVSAGAVLQLNAGSFRGRYGAQAQALAMRYLRSGWAHFLASDAHRVGRGPILGQAVAALSSVVGLNYLSAITEAAGRCVISGIELPPLPSVVSTLDFDDTPRKLSTFERLQRAFGR